MRIRNETLDNIMYMVKNWFKWNGKSSIVLFIKIPVFIFIPTINAIIPKCMIDAINAHMPLYDFFIMILGLSISAAFFNFVGPYLNGKVVSLNRNVNVYYTILAFKKLLEMSYVNLESYDGRLRFERAKKFAMGDEGVASSAIDSLTTFVTNILGIVTYSVIIGVANPIMLLIMIVASGFEFVFTHIIMNIDIQTKDKQNPLEHKFEYFYRVSLNHEMGKDIRMCKFSEWICQWISKTLAEYFKIVKWYTKQTIRYSVLRALCAMVRDAAVFFFLLFDVINSKISPSDFILYFGLMTGFGAWLRSSADQVANLHRISIECQRFRDFINYHDESINLESKEENIPSVIEKIEFRNVSFSYGDKIILKNITFTVNKNEKIAIVGENGAGKTTLIKLLCGLYSPQKGEILVNGICSSRFTKESYFELFAAIFQDYAFLPTSIKQNIALGNVDECKLEEIIHKVGLADKIRNLNNGLDSKLVKQMNEQAVDLSGGEKQRLLMARAIYKNAPILILDEPTASLDPISEERIYKQYDELTRNKISFYISHRLSSTQFCDRIFFLKDCEIKEVGTHEELMKLRGEYWNMFENQACYYR